MANPAKDYTGQEWKNLKQAISKAAAASPRPYYAVCVDDEPLILDIIKDRVSDLGLKTETFLDARSAIEFLKANHGDVVLILSDVKMPEMDGFAFRSEVLTFCPQVPFAVLSAHVTKEMALLGIENKISAFLSKPLNDNELAAMVTRDLTERINKLAEDRDLVAGFLDDARNLVEQIEQNALELESNLENRDQFNGIFGMVHTLKGGCGFFESKDLHRFIHRFEDLLKPIQSGERPVSSGVVTMILKAVDYLREWLGDIEVGRTRERDIEGQLAMLKTLQASGAGGALAGAAAGGDSDKKDGTNKPRELRVDISILDEFLQASGEMTVIRNMLIKTVSTLEKKYQSDRDVQLLTELLDELHKINAQVQNKITEVRKVSMRTILRPVPRAVREVSRSLAKTIDLVVSGEDVRVDTSVAEVLNNSLLHLVKNSLDHGLEVPQERINAGKSGRGKVEVTAKIADEMVYVEVRDDGRGINTEAIKAKLLKNGVNPNDVARMSEEELRMQIFAAGFSTAAQTTDISGRGVGMSMVKESVESIGGNIRINSVKGKGTSFILELPVPKSVLIKNCLFVDCNSQSFGIPQDQIVRVYQSSEDTYSDSIVELEGAYTLRLSEEVIPLINLSETLKGQKKNVLDKDFKAIIVQTTGERTFGLIVDSVGDFEDAVVKPVVERLRQLEYYSGATFLGDGKIGLIFDVDGIARRGGISTKKAKSANEASAAAKTLAETTTPYVTFELGIPGTYALPQSQVYRIEEIDPADLQFSADMMVIPYRGNVMPIVDLSEQFGKRLGTTGQTSKGGNANNRLQIVVVEQMGRFWGLYVKSISDIVSGPIDLLAPVEKEMYSVGMMIVNGKSIAVLDNQHIITSYSRGVAVDSSAANHSEFRTSKESGAAA